MDKELKETRRTIYEQNEGIKTNIEMKKSKRERNFEREETLACAIAQMKLKNFVLSV